MRLQLKDLHVEVRMRPLQAGHRRDGHGVDRALERPEPHQTRRFLPEAAQLRLDALHVVEDRPGPAREDQPGRGEPHPAPRAFEQLGAGLGLEHGELLRHARRAQVRGLGHRPHGAQGVQLAQQAQPPGVHHPLIVVRFLRTGQPEL
ncbi:Siderophore biosynthesis diaminobutyrate--2-oxoglutarate aminotransferase [Streptomyces alboflavus]|uniref:Siderophore biosynthesis diaminobutyrate--2-oxoglutarate aminotransferase n=1 Tax=Streptomyces alboflavus TaxID=67267 RepID=A0A1Z1WSB7_9ACTN|nr:Siderophore biosynthesis diaminobutyrate--2-oxoglutarate aminotransferase [Streptomyces alboflavus]